LKQFITKVIYNKQIAPDHYVLSFRTRRSAGKIIPGQFFNIKVAETLDPLLRRPFGVHKINGEKIEILYKVFGKATKLLSK